MPKNFILITHAIGKFASHLTLAILTLKPGKNVFDDLVSYIEDIVINEGEVVRISCISKIYENIQKDKGIASQRTSHFLLKARLQNHFKGRIDFFRKNETSTDLIYDTSEEPIQFRRNTIEVKVKKVAAIIRDEIKDFKGTFSS